MFGLTARGTSVRTEILAGATTFLTMAYIVVVNPLILGQAGLPIEAVTAATCLAAAFGCILMGFMANVPLAMAPGMGLNAYFTFVVVKGMGVPWQTALGCVFISGVVFLILTLAGVRQLIVNAIPRSLFAAVAAGIGLFIAFIGLKDAGIVVADPGTTVGLGDLTKPEALTALAGKAIIAALMIRKVKAAILIGVLLATALGAVLGLVHYTPGGGVQALADTAFKLDLKAAVGLNGGGAAALIEIIFVFLFVDLFDNVGTLVAVTKKAGLVDADGRIPKLNRILLTDSIASMVGAVAGTTTVTSYIESSAGVAAGGRTGLTAIVVGLLFLLALFVAPLVRLVPTAAAAPALILVGAMMMSSLGEIDWTDPMVAIPAFLTLIAIPLTFSIANGLAFGITAYAVLKLLSGKASKADVPLFLLALLFVLRFLYLGRS